MNKFRDSVSSIRHYIFVGATATGLLVFGVGGWAATTEISGAVIASGKIVVDSNVKKVQHLTGGVVGKLYVRDGDRVKAGQILVQLDDTVTKANLAIVTKGLTELEARKARLAAERDGTTKIAFPPDLLDHRTNPDVVEAMRGEQKLFDLRRSARSGKKAQLQQRIDQLGQEIVGFDSQLKAKAEETALIRRELAAIETLYQKNLVPLSRISALQREAARLDGERGQLIASKAQAKGKIAELNLQIIQIDQDMASDVAKEMRDIDAKIGEFVERKVSALDQLKRTDIRAPQDGTVFESKVHTVGGVIPPGETIMLIVPDADKLLVQARVNPQDIDKVELGQPAALRFSGLDSRTTLDILGRVARISADAATDQRTGASYYTIRITMPAAEVAKLGDVRLVPGMPVETFIQTGDRTVMAYLLKPLSDQISRAFREK